jgi:hypothetical protein
MGIIYDVCMMLEKNPCISMEVLYQAAAGVMETYLKEQMNE